MDVNFVNMFKSTKSTIDLLLANGGQCLLQYSIVLINLFITNKIHPKQAFKFEGERQTL